MRIFLFIALFFPLPAFACDTAACAVDAIAGPFDNAGKLSGTLFIRRGPGLVARSYGIADEHWQLPNTLGTIFAVASVSKGFVAATVLKLIEESRLHMEDKVADLLPEYPRRNLTGRGGRAVTLEDLLTHESGVPEAYDTATIEARMDRSPLSFPDMIAAIDDKGLLFVPGSRFDYSNTGYVLLGEIVRRASGVTSEIFLRENFLEPLGMESTTVTAPALPSETVARSYELARGKRTDYEERNHLVSIAGGEVFADTNIYSNAPDLAKWTEAMTSGAVLSAATTQAMLTPRLGGYGYGWIIYRDQAGRLAYEHSGDYGGFQSWVRRYPEQNTTVVWLANQAMTERDLNSFYEGVAKAALDSNW